MHNRQSAATSQRAHMGMPPPSLPSLHDPCTANANLQDHSAGRMARCRARLNWLPGILFPPRVPQSCRSLRAAVRERKSPVHLRRFSLRLQRACRGRCGKRCQRSSPPSQSAKRAERHRLAVEQSIRHQCRMTKQPYRRRGYLHVPHQA